MNIRNIFFTAALICICKISVPQVFYGKNAERFVNGAERVKISNNIPVYIKLKQGHEIDIDDLNVWLHKTFKLPEGYGYKYIRTEKDVSGDIHYVYCETVNNIPIHNAVFIAHIKENKMYALNGTILNDITTDLNTGITEGNALNKALQYIDAEVYKWQMPEEENYLRLSSGNISESYFPKGELTIVPYKGDAKSGDYRLAYRFNIYAQKPLKRENVFVDANTGEIVYSVNLIRVTNAVGTANTKYSSTQSITADSYSGYYRLRETGRGSGIETYDMNQGTSYSSSVDFTDTDNNWNNFNADLDEVATDAHWGAEKTYDYYYSKFGRNSIDGNGFKLKNYVHFDVDYYNAFWDGQRMTYGDGSGYPLCSVDIVGHEITHGLTENTANLDYQDESGALNEGYSDIFGTCIEFYAKPGDANWTMGEDINDIMRSLSNPNSYGLPDTYHGNNWYYGTSDNGGVHTNSGVLGYWFYLTSQGGTGTNDNGDNYSVAGIGKDEAAAIAYRTLAVYLTNTSQYEDACYYSIQSAVDLYGPCSPEVEAVTNAMHAIGLQEEYVDSVISDFYADEMKFCSAPADVQFFNQSMNASSFKWNFGDGSPVSTLIDPSHTYNSVGDYTVTLIADGGSCGKDTLIKTLYVSINSSNPCSVTLPESGSAATQTSCEGILYDSGGKSEYQNNTSSTVTIAPAGAFYVTLNFSSFDFEDGYDYLYIYDGPNTSSPLIGAYTGYSLPNGGTIYSSGSSVTINQFSDQYVTGSGFKIEWSCSYPGPPVADYTSSEASRCNGIIQFEDNSISVPSSWQWDFGDGSTSTLENPVHAYSEDGNYYVTLIASNVYGSDTILKDYITIDRPDKPVAVSDTSCGPDSLTLTATGSGDINWYDNSTEKNPFYTGNTYNTPFLDSSVTYYVENELAYPLQYCSPHDSAMGAGKYFNNSNFHYLKFNCYTDITLVSVKVYAENTKNRTIILYDNNNNVVEDTTVSIAAGASRVTLNFNIPAGNGYMLQCETSYPQLYRNSVGASYPYVLPGILAITGNSADNANYYYYFYDWEVQRPSCKSARVPIIAGISYDSPVADFGYFDDNPRMFFKDSSLNGVIYHWDFGDSTTSAEQNPVHTYTVNGTYDVTLIVINGCGSDTISDSVNIYAVSVENRSRDYNVRIYPNPADDKLNIDISSDMQQNLKLELIDMLGKMLWSENISDNKGVYHGSIDINSYPAGIYFISISGENLNICRKIVVY